MRPHSAATSRRMDSAAPVSSGAITRYLTVACFWRYWVHDGSEYRTTSVVGGARPVGWRRGRVGRPAGGPVADGRAARAGAASGAGAGVQRGATLARGGVALASRGGRPPAGGVGGRAAR